MKWIKFIKHFKIKLSINNSLQDASEKSNIIKNNLKQLKNGKRNFNKKNREKTRSSIR